MSQPPSKLRAFLVIVATTVLLISTQSTHAAEPSDYLSGAGRHPLYHKALPPGMIWKSPAAIQVKPAYFQPVAFSGPEGVKFNLPQQGALSTGEPDLMAGLMVGAVYRFRITNIPSAAGAELYPTVELIGRTYPPPGLATSFPIPINLSETDMQEALAGNLVTRVIYLEDPQTAVPMAVDSKSSRALDIGESEDALAIADEYGRPVAIVRMGSVAPPRAEALKPQFYFGFPTWAPIFKPEATPLAEPTIQPEAAIQTEATTGNETPEMSTL